MGKRRKTAKTGDRALSRGGRQIEKPNNLSEDDPMYNDIDNFHNQKDADFLRLDRDDMSSQDGEADDGISRQEAVMDLGAAVDDDESSSESDDSASPYEGAGTGKPYESEEEEEISLSSDDSDDKNQDYQIGDPRKWGKKKGAYYHGDTADLEIGQDEDDAYLEEEAAKEVQSARLKQMKEDDFVLSGDENEEDDGEDASASGDVKGAVALDATTNAVTRDLSKLSTKSKRKLLETQHPELLPIVSYFSDIVKDLKDKTMVATKALMEGEQGTAEVSGTAQELINLDALMIGWSIVSCKIFLKT